MKKLHPYLAIYFLLSTSTVFAQQYVWTQKADYGGGEMYNAFSFAIGTKGYAGSGFNVSRTYHKDFWEWDQATNVWTQKADFTGAGREGSKGFSIGDTGYVTTGYAPGSGFLNDLWEYDPSNNTWTQKKSLPAAARYLGVTFTLLGKGYFGLGSLAGNTYHKDVWQYDPATDSWSQKADFPGTERGASSRFVINNEAYVGLGSNVSLHINFSDFYKYNPTSNTWTKVADFPGPPRNGAYCFNINKNGYVLGGYDYVQSFPTVFPDFYKYDPVLNGWTKLPDFPGKHIVEGIYFEIGIRGYVGIGNDTSSFTHFQKSFWEYGPINNLSVTSIQKNVSCYGGSDGSDSLFVTGGTPPYTYLWSPGGQTTSVITGLPAGTYTCVITDSQGQSVSETVTITQPSVDQSLDVTISASTTSGCLDHTIYIGYGPQKVTLTANTSIPVTSYQWYVNGKLIPGATSQTLVVSKGGSYNVVISAGGGCSSDINNTAPVVVNVVDIRCGDKEGDGHEHNGECKDGNKEHKGEHQGLHDKGGDKNGDKDGHKENHREADKKGGHDDGDKDDDEGGNGKNKVLICHTVSGHSQTLCIATSAVAAHLKNHAYDCLGPCNLQPKESAETSPPNEDVILNIYPNPLTSVSTIEFKRTSESAHMLAEIFTLTGKKIATLFDKDAEAGITYKTEFNGSQLDAGIYLCRITDGKEVSNYKLLLMK